MSLEYRPPEPTGTHPVLPRFPVTSAMDNGGDTLDFRNLKVVTAVGRGAKGVVFLARTYDGSNEQWLALKVVSKAFIQKKNSGHCKRVSFEQQILRRFDHPLLPRLRGVLETEELVGFAIDYCHGGNMHSLRKRQSEKTFSDEAIRYLFYFSCPSFFLYFGYPESVGKSKRGGKKKTRSFCFVLFYVNFRSRKTIPRNRSGLEFGLNIDQSKTENLKNFVLFSGSARKYQKK